jgi:hypothetical protein
VRFFHASEEANVQKLIEEKDMMQPKDYKSILRGIINSLLPEHDLHQAWSYY